MAQRDDTPRRRPRGPYIDPPHWTHRLLSADEELALARRAKTGDREARDALVLHNQRLLQSLAKPYLGGFHELSDLVAAGSLGLMRAIELYDPESGNRFTTYAIRWALSYILREIRDRAHLVRVPAHLQGQIRTVQRLRRDQPEAGVPEASEALRLRPKQAQALEAALRVHGALHGDLLDDDGRPLGDQRDYVAQADARMDADTLLARVTPAQARVLRLMYEESWKMGEIAAQDGCTISAIQNRQRRALATLRSAVGA